MQRSSEKKQQDSEAHPLKQGHFSNSALVTRAICFGSKLIRPLHTFICYCLPFQEHLVFAWGFCLKKQNMWPWAVSTCQPVPGHETWFIEGCRTQVHPGGAGPPGKSVFADNSGQDVLCALWISGRKCVVPSRSFWQPVGDLERS